MPLSSSIVMEQHTLRAAELLPDEDDAGDLDVAAIADAGEIGTAGHPTPAEIVAQERYRMGAE